MATQQAVAAPAVRVPALLAIGCIVVTVTVVAALHVVPPTSRISPIHRTISEYGLSTLAPVFSGAVWCLVAGSLCLGVALARIGALRPVAGALGALWAVGLAIVAVVPKHNWAIGPSSTGNLHRLAALVAFVALPCAVLTIRAQAGRPPAHRRAARWCAAAGLACFVPVILAIAFARVLTVPWYQAVPLGLVERAMALADLAALVLLALWALGTRAVRPADGHRAARVGGHATGGRPG